MSPQNLCRYISKNGNCDKPCGMYEFCRDHRGEKCNVCFNRQSIQDCDNCGKAVCSDDKCLENHNNSCRKAKDN